MKVRDTMAKRIPLADDPRLEGGSVENIVDAYQNASEVDIFEGREWYAVANAIATGIHANGAGIMAALSPSASWDLNVTMAREIVADRDCQFQSWDNKKKALRILDGEKPLDVLGGNKVRAFYKAIAGVDTEPVIDRHAFSVYLGRHSTDKNTKVITDRKGAYQLVADAYRKAAAILGVDNHTVQATTWVAWRRINGIS